MAVLSETKAAPAETQAAPAETQAAPVATNEAVSPTAAPNLSARLAAEQPTIAATKVAIIDELSRFGIRHFDQLIDKGLGGFELRVDPYDKSQSLCALWRNDSGEQCGNLQILGNGQVFAEFDVLLDHPGDKRWFIEGVTVWGQGKGFRAELQLLPALGA